MTPLSSHWRRLNSKRSRRFPDSSIVQDNPALNAAVNSDAGQAILKGALQYAANQALGGNPLIDVAIIANTASDPAVGELFKKIGDSVNSFMDKYSSYIEPTMEVAAELTIAVLLAPETGGASLVIGLGVAGGGLYDILHQGLAKNPKPFNSDEFHQTQLEGGKAAVLFGVAEALGVRRYSLLGPIP